MAAAVALVVVGLPLFLAPSWAPKDFAWKVSPFVAMTAGGWCLGTAGFALLALRRPTWTEVRAAVAYVFAFGLTEMGVAVYERERLITDKALSWPYLVALGLSIAAGAYALLEGRRQFRPDRRSGWS